MGVLEGCRQEMSYPSKTDLLERISEKLSKHDKSLFTAMELNLLKDLVNYELSRQHGNFM